MFLFTCLLKVGSSAMLTQILNLTTTSLPVPDFSCSWISSLGTSPQMQSTLRVSKVQWSLLWLKAEHGHKYAIPLL